MATDFLNKPVERLGKPVFRLGLACNYGIDEAAFEVGIERGMNYLFWSPFRTSAVTPALKRAIARDRERYVLACGPTVAWFGGNVRRGCESLLRRLGTDYIDVFQLYWLGVSSAWTDAVRDELLKLREEGKVRALGVSIHDRVRAGRLAEDSPLDLLMIRYNLAHPGAERDIFPKLAVRNPMVVAYTATSWGKLLRRPKGWQGPLLTAADCYRFCLSNPLVDVTLTGPKNRRELEENLDGLERGPLSAEESHWMREFGSIVHG